MTVKMTTTLESLISNFAVKRDFSTLESLNANFAAEKAEFGWPEPHGGERLSKYVLRVKDECDDPRMAFINTWNCEDIASVTVLHPSDGDLDQFNDTMSDVLDEIVDEEWSSALEDADDDLSCWMPLKEEFMRDHDQFEDEWGKALEMLPGAEELRLDP